MPGRFARNSKIDKHPVIRQTKEKLESTGSVQDKPRSGAPKYVIPDEKIEDRSSFIKE